MGEKVNRIKGIFESKEKKIDDLAIRCADKIMSFISEPCAELQKYQVGEVPDFLEKGQINDEIIKFLKIMAFDMARVPNIYKAAKDVKEYLTKENKHFSKLYKDGEKNKNKSAAHAILNDSSVTKNGDYGLPIFFAQYIPRMDLFTQNIDKERDNLKKSDLDNNLNKFKNNLNKFIEEKGNKNDTDLMEEKQQIENLIKVIGEYDKDKDMNKLLYGLKNPNNGSSNLLSALKKERDELANTLTSPYKQVKYIVNEMYDLVSDKFKNTKEDFLDKAMRYVVDGAEPSPTLSVKFKDDVKKTYNEGSISAKNAEVTQLGRVIANLLDKVKNTRDNAKVELNDSKELEKKYNEFEKEYLKCIDELSKLVNNNNNENNKGNILKYINLKNKECESNLNLSNVNNMTKMYALKLKSFCEWSKGLNDGFNIIDNKALGAKKLTEMKKITEEAKEFLENYREYLPESEGQKQNVKT